LWAELKYCCFISESQIDIDKNINAGNNKYDTHSNQIMLKMTTPLQYIFPTCKNM